MDFEKLLVNKHYILKNNQLNWFNEITKSTNKLFLCFLLVLLLLLKQEMLPLH